MNNKEIYNLISELDFEMSDNVDYEEAWKLIKSVFQILDDASQFEDKPVLTHVFNQVITFVIKNGIAQHIQNLMVIKIQKKLREEVVPEFWSYFKNSNLDNTSFQQFYNAIKCLHDNYKILDRAMQKLLMFKQAAKLNDQIYNEPCALSALKLMLRSTMLSQLNCNYQYVVMNFYECALKMEDIEETNDCACVVCSQKGGCNCLHLFQETNRYLFII